MAKPSENFHPVTHVIFDMDGLLFDTEPIYENCSEKICSRYGKEYDQETNKAIQGCTAHSSCEKMISMLNLPLTVDELLAEYNRMFVDAFVEYVPFMPGVERLVKHLKEHDIPICIASSCQEATFQLISNHHESFFQLFHHAVKGSDDDEVKNGKPAPDVFLVAAKRFGDDAPTDMKNVLVFEDSVNGVKAGLAAGMQVVWVPAPNADRTATDATLILPSLEEFKPELFGLPKYK